MLTPQQIQEISFEKAVFGGYDMGSVDDFLEPLTEDYITLYKENSVLKSKMRILVEKLEEYRRQEGSMQNALMAAQKTCDQMIAETEKKCAKLLREAEETASKKAQNADVLVGNEEDFQLCLGFKGPEAGGKDLKTKIENFKGMIREVQTK